jgi:hypothetical protein
MRRRRRPEHAWPPGLARFSEAAWARPEDDEPCGSTSEQQAVWRWIDAHRRWRNARREWLRANGLPWLEEWIADVQAEHRKRATLQRAS